MSRHLTHPLSSSLPLPLQLLLPGRNCQSGWGSSAHGAAVCGRAEASTAASVSGAAIRGWSDYSRGPGAQLLLRREIWWRIAIDASSATREESRCLRVLLTSHGEYTCIFFLPMTSCAEEFQKWAANYDSIARRLWLFRSQLITLSGTRDQEESGDLEALYSARAPGLGDKSLTSILGSVLSWPQLNLEI